MDGHAIRAAAAEGLKRKTIEDFTADAEDEGAKKTQLKKELRSSTSISVKDSTNALAKFASVLEHANDYKLEEIAVGKEANMLAARKIKLEEKCYLLDKAEREAQFALEQQERQGLLDIMRGTLE
ncbi:hypothetical protein DYB32_007084 [Aphanomyces invadans]|uniref:No apical meristem-associated C-terminal domain-containing protein n=1 Tax=Aphanomyces invadans TaxID=157072 RepID=A0A3R6VU05_9STRA|nr:hypothetical protein DYB32_007084 [Aphanomyces invadans]